MPADRLVLDLTVNGQTITGVVEPRTLLSDYLRHGVGMTGVHVGCGHGVCGACTIVLDGRPVRSCLMFAVQARSHDVTTIEGLADGNEMHPVQEAFPSITACSAASAHREWC